MKDKQLEYMDYQEIRDDAEVDLKALFITVCERWRWILLFTFMGALLGAGFKYMKERREVANTTVEACLNMANAITLEKNESGLSPTDSSQAGLYRTAIANYEEALSLAETDEAYYPVVLENRKVIDTIQEDIAETREYIDNSLLLKANSPSGVRLAVLLEVDDSSLQEEKEARILTLYKNYLNSDDTYEDLAEIWGTKAKYLNELVDSIETREGYSDDTDEDIDQYLEEKVLVEMEGLDLKEDDDGSGFDTSYLMTVIGVSQEKADEMLAYMLDKCEAYSNENEEIAGVQLKALSIGSRLNYTRTVMTFWQDAMLRCAQMEALTAKYKLFANANAEAIEAIEADAKDYVTASGSGTASGSEDTTERHTLADEQQENADTTQKAGSSLGNRPINKKSLLKWGLIGAFVGMFGCFGILLIKFVIGGYVLSETEVDDLYRLRHLVTLKNGESNRHSWPFDRWLQKIKQDRTYRFMNEKQRYEVLETKIRNFSSGLHDEEQVGSHAGMADQKTDWKLILAGTSEQDPLEEISAKLGHAMNGTRITLHSVPALNSDRAALESLEESAGVILIITAEHSRQESVARTIETVQYYGKEIVGTVAVL